MSTGSPNVGGTSQSRRVRLRGSIRCGSRKFIARWLCLCVLLSEVGTGTHLREKFRSAAAFASWLGLCPDNRISGGRILKAGTRKVCHRIANILRMAAHAFSRAEGPMGDDVRRFKGRLGKAEGIVAGAHKLARIIWALVTKGQPYDGKKAFQLTPASAARRLQHLQNKLKL